MKLKPLSWDRITHVVFDGMDTLVPRGDRQAEATQLYNYLCSQLPGRPLRTLEEFRAAIAKFESRNNRGITVAQEAVARVAAIGYRNPPVEQAIALLDGMAGVVATGLQPYPGATQTLRRLQASGKRVLLYSTALHLGRIALEKTGLLQLLDEVYFSVRLGETKEAGSGFVYITLRQRELLRQGDLLADQFVLVDDKELHCRKAKLVGWQAILVFSPEGHATRQRNEGHDQRNLQRIHLPWVNAVADLQQVLGAR